MLFQHINSSIGAKVKVEPSYSGNNGLWAVEPNASSTDVTLKVSDTSESGSAKVSFDLSGVNEDTTATSDNGVEFKLNNDKTTAKVEVPKKVGNYSLVLKSGDNSQTINIHVVDVTLPDYTKVTFEEIQEEDVSKVATSASTSADVLANMQDVYQQAHKQPGKTEFNSITIKYLGNVNKMTISKNASGVDGKYYWARVKVQQFDISKLKASYVKDNKVINLETVPVPENSGSVFVLLDANMSVTNLIMANSQSTDAQILKASSESKFNTVTFDSTSILQRYTAWKSGNVNTGDNSVGTQNQYVFSVKADETISNKVHVNVNFGFSDVLLNTKTFKIDTEASADTKEGKWVPIAVQLLETGVDQNLKTLLTIDGDGVILQTVDTNKTSVFLWVNADAVGSKFCTLTYTDDKGTTESLTLEIELHNAAKPVIEAVYEGTDGNSKGVIVNDIKPTVTSTTYTGSVDTYKYGMDVIDKPDGTSKNKGRWYNVLIETQLPTDSLVYEASGKWAELPQEMIVDTNTIQVLVNRDEHTNSTPFSLIKLANKWTVKVGNVTSGDSRYTIDVQLKQNEKSKTALSNELTTFSDDVGTKNLKDTFINELEKLTGITIETIEEDSGRLSTNNKKSYGTFDYTLDNLKDFTITNTTTDTATTANIKLNSANVSDILLNTKRRKMDFSIFRSKRTCRNNNR